MTVCPALSPAEGTLDASKGDYGVGLSSSPGLYPTSSWARTMGGGSMDDSFDELAPLDDLTPPASPPLPAKKDDISRGSLLGGLSGSSRRSIPNSASKDDGELDETTRQTSLYLVEEVLCGGGKSSSTGMRRTSSLPEMVEMNAMRDFDDAMCAMTSTGDAQGNKEVTGDKSQGRESLSAPPLVAASVQLPPASTTTGFGNTGAKSSMRRSQSFAGFAGLSEMARSSPSGAKGLSFLGAIDEKAPIQWKPHDPRAQPRRSSLKRTASICSTVSLGSSVDGADSASAAGDAEEARASSPTEPPQQPQSETSMKRNVSFSSLEIFEHGMTLGDNPCVTAGPPVTLEWRPCGHYSHDLEEYEEARANLRRNKGQMQMNENVRFFRLMRDQGFTAMQIKVAVDEVSRTKKNRRDTVSGLGKARLEEALESAERKMKRLFKKGKMNKM